MVPLLKDHVNLVYSVFCLVSSEEPSFAHAWIHFDQKVRPESPFAISMLDERNYTIVQCIDIHSAVRPDVLMES